MPDSFDEAFPDGFEECVRTLGSEPSVDDPEALCGWLSEHGFEEIAGSEVEDVLVSLDVEFVSVVEEPAQNSEWLLAKSADASVESWDPQTTPLHNSEVLIKQSEEGEDGPAEKKAWAAVLTPEPDAHGDIVPDPEIEDAAHGYLKNYRKVDSDHNLLDGTGVPIESYIVRDGPETFETPGGDTKTHQPGTWIMGVELTAEAWEGVKNGEYTGFSIYGGGNSLDPESLLTDEQLDRVRQMKQVSKELVPGSFSFEEEDAAELVSEAFGMEGETHEHEGGIMPGPSHEAFVEFLADIADGEEDEENGEVSGEDDEEEVEDRNDSGDEAQTDDHGPDDEDDEEKAEWKDDENPCWDGYVMVGTKVDENGNEVPRCVPEEDAEAMAKHSGDGDNTNMTDENSTDGKLDELLDRTDNIGNTVEEVQKSVETLDSRVDELEEWKKSVVGEATDDGNGEDDAGAAESDEDLSEEEVEEIAANAAEDAAEEGAQKALAKYLGLDEEEVDDLDDEEVVRKAKQTVGTDSAVESGSGEEVDLSFSGITENL